MHAAAGRIAAIAVHVGVAAVGEAVGGEPARERFLAEGHEGGRRLRLARPHVGVDVAQDGTGLVVVAVGEEGAVQLAACRTLLLGDEEHGGRPWRIAGRRLVLEMPETGIERLGGLDHGRFDDFVRGAGEDVHAAHGLSPMADRCGGIGRATWTRAWRVRSAGMPRPRRLPAMQRPVAQ